MTAAVGRRRRRLRLRTRLRRWWRHDRLRLAGLPRAVRVAAWALLALLGAEALLLALLTLGWGAPGGTIAVPSTIGAEVVTVDLAFVVLLWAALAVLGSSALLLAGLDGARRPRLLLVGVGLLTTTFMGGLIGLGDDLHTFEREGLADGGLAAWRLVHAVGWSGLVLGVLTMVVPRAVLRAHPAVPIVLGGLPFAGGLAVALLGSAASFRLGGLLPEVGEVTAQALAARPFVDAAFLLSVALVVMLYWQTATWARAGRRDVGLRVAGAVRDWVPFLWLLLAAKAALLLAGYLGAGPCVADRAAASAWTLSACDGLASWLIAGIFAALVGLWLVRPSRLALSERYLAPVSAAVIIGFSLSALAIALVTLPVALVAVVEVRPLADVGPFPECAAVALGNGLQGVLTCALGAIETVGVDAQLPPLLTIAALVAGGALLAATRRYRLLGVTMLIFGLWGAPRAMDALLAVTGPVDSRSPSVGLELATFDAALTVVLIGVAVITWRARDLTAQAAIALVLVVSTLAAHGSTLLPLDLEAALGYVLLAVPLIYLVLYDARGLNRAGPDRPVRVLGALVAGVGLLVLAATAVTLDTVDIDRARLLPTLLFLVPFAALLVGASVSAMYAPQNATTPPAQPPKAEAA